MNPGRDPIALSDQELREIAAELAVFSERQEERARRNELAVDSCWSALTCVLLALLALAMAGMENRALLWLSLVPGCSAGFVLCRITGWWWREGRTL